MEELKKYIESNKVNAVRLNAEVRDANMLAYPKRNLFVKLSQYSNDFLTKKGEPRLIAISGLRGVGKTTLMWQTAEVIFEGHTQNVFFLNGNDLKNLGYNLYQAFQVFEDKVIGKPFYQFTEPVVFLIDEIHDIENWDKDLKILYDKCKQAFIICTGSSALLLHRSADLASRMTLIKLFPFRFAEFILSSTWMNNKDKLLFAKKGLGDKLKQTLFFSKDISQLQNGLNHIQTEIKEYLQDIHTSLPKKKLGALVDEYVSYHNIARFLPLKNKEIINERVIALFERILFKDLPVFDKNANAEILLRLLMRLALSDEVNFQTLSRDFGKQENIEHFIDLLDKAEILNIFLPYGGVKTKTGKNIKPFFMSPSLRRALFTRIYGDELRDDLRAKLYEDIVAMYLRRTFDKGLLSFGMSEQGVSPDFIIETLDSPVILEVGINKKTKKQVTKYQENKRYGIIVNSKINDVKIEGDCLFLPLHWFLLL